MSYTIQCIAIPDGTTISLRFIESIRFQKEEEDVVVDKLKDDLTFYIRTVSGKEYAVSTRYMLERLEKDMPLINLASDIFNTWRHLHGDTS